MAAARSRPTAAMPHPLVRFTASDGQSIHLKRRGHGRPLVLLHGWTSSHADWAHVTTALAGECESFAWDARAHAGHPLTGAPATVARMADDLAELIAHFALVRPVLVGHSMGVLTIWEYLRRHGGAAIAGLCLIDQSPKLVTDAGWRHGIYGDFDAIRARWFAARQREDFAEAVLELAAGGHNRRMAERYAREPEKFQRSREHLRGLDAAALTACWLTLAAGDWRAVLPTIAVPTLLVYGAESNFYAAATAAWVQAQIPGAQRLSYPGADHSPHFWHRDRFVTDLRGLLARVDGGAA